MDSICLLEKGKPEISNDKFSKGEEIVVINGPLSGLKGTLLMKKGSKRLLVNIYSVGRTVTVEISPYEIEKVRSQHSVAC